MPEPGNEFDAGLDLARYLDRIGLASPPPATAAGLAAIHEAHATRIPFENIDVLLGRRISLGVGEIQAKLVDARRGGYCFEQNMLLAAALESCGFGVQRLSARVRYRTRAKLPRTHMLLRVEAEGASWLADVGFGASGLIRPLRLKPDVIQHHPMRTHRLVEKDGVWTLQGNDQDGWEDYYAFTLEPPELADFVMANHYVSTYPESPFVRRLTAQLPLPHVRHMLRGRELTIERDTGIETRRIGDDELRPLLRDTFLLDLPDDLAIPPTALDDG